MNTKKEIIIIGTGGFARELTEYVYQNNKFYKQKNKIVGYLDINKQNYLKYNYDAPFLGSEMEYIFQNGITVYIGIGDVAVRKKIINYLEEKNIKFDNFIHYTSIIHSKLKLGEGNIICPYVIIGPDVEIGNFNLINYNTCIPHDCKVGNNNVFSPNVQITGNCLIGNNNFFGVSSGCIPNITFGDNNKIQAGIIVDKNIESNKLVFITQSIKKVRLY